MNKILRTNGITLQWAPFAVALMLLFATIFAQPTQAASIINTIKCNALTLFASASKTTMKVSAAAMEKTFELELSVMQTAWQLEDAALTALRTVGESAFSAALNAFANRPGIFIKNTEFRDAATKEYHDKMLNSLHVHEVNIDAARASYREDMLALVRAHQKALRTLVNTLIGTIDAALNTALANCSSKNVVATLTAVIAKAGATLLAEGLLEEARTLAKAAVLVLTRNQAFLKEGAEFASESTQYTLALGAAFLTRQ